MQFEEEMEALLERHVLKGLVDAPWIRTDDLRGRNRAVREKPAYNGHNFDFKRDFFVAFRRILWLKWRAISIVGDG
jgi:hypothetical protein